MTEPMPEGPRKSKEQLRHDLQKLINEYVSEHYDGALVTDYLLVMAAMPSDDPDALLIAYATPEPSPPLYRTRGLIAMAEDYYSVANYVIDQG